MTTPIQIIGGGLAGLTLGIGLRQRDVPVTIVEAGHYPRHKVCGEFISGRGQEVLRRLGLHQKFVQAGACSAQTAAFFSPTKSSPAQKLPEPALCLSRHVMDKMLADEFRQLGGELRQDERWRREFGEGIVRASGRRMQPTESDWHWFGVKAHARQVELTADLEMHVSPHGYVGLCRLQNGEVNACGLFRRRAGGNESAQSRLELLKGPAGTPLHQRLDIAVFQEDSLCSVAGLSLRPQHAVNHNECCLGDALTMIAPMTGNGMSISFESAEIAIEPLTAWSRGKISWQQAQQTIARQCDAAFARRLRWARWLQGAVFTPVLQNWLITLVAHNRWFWNLAFARTR